MAVSTAAGRLAGRPAGDAPVMASVAPAAGRLLQAGPLSRAAAPSEVPATAEGAPPDGTPAPASGKPGVPARAAAQTGALRRRVEAEGPAAAAGGPEEFRVRQARRQKRIEAAGIAAE